ncbi:MAG: c-type cytochrome [Nitrospirae bacterium]|nr:c-type cytochrome [Nitrospirota bacterium]
MKGIVSVGRWGKILLAGGLVVTVLGVSVVFTTAQTGKAPEAPKAQMPGKASPEDLAAGKAIYFRKCVWCHGPEGAGDGPAADRLWPRPRNFTQGTFKIRHTASGELPLLDDLFLTVTNGLPGSAMPSWEGILSDKQRHQVVEFVRTELVKDRDFTDKENETFTPISFGKQVATSKESIERGREVYMNKGKCVECHGPDARGDGNATQKDEWGFPIRPADLHKCWNFRGNRRDPYNPTNIFREVSTGLNGTPMPSFAEALSSDQRWDVANFVISLCPKKNIDPLTTKPNNDFVIKATFVKGELPTSPDDAVWKDVSAAYVGLGSQIMHKPRNFVRLVDDVWVRSLYNDKQVMYLLEWDDRTKSLGTPEAVAQTADFKETPPAGEPIAMRQYPVFNDAVAIQFPSHWETLSAPEKPRFVFGDAKNSVDVWKWEADGSTKLYTGQGFDKLEVRAGDSVKTPFVGFKDGVWRVMFTRTLTTDDKEHDVQFTTGKYIPTSFFVWDGNNGDHGLKMSISTWYYTILLPPVPKKAYIYPVFAAIFVIGLQFWMVSKFKKGSKK